MQILVLVFGDYPGKEEKLACIASFCARAAAVGNLPHSPMTLDAVQVTETMQLLGATDDPGCICPAVDGKVCFHCHVRWSEISLRLRLIYQTGPI